MRSSKAHLSENEKEALAVFAGRVRQRSGRNLFRICLFGSKVRGTAHPGSDIDVLAVVRSLSSGVKDGVFDAAFDVNLEYNVFISPRVVPSRIFSSRVWRITPFVLNVKKEGIPL